MRRRPTLESEISGIALEARGEMGITESAIREDLVALGSVGS